MNLDTRQQELAEKQRLLNEETKALQEELRAQEGTPEWCEKMKEEIITLTSAVGGLKSQLAQEKLAREGEKQEFNTLTIERDQLAQELNQELNLVKQELTSTKAQLDERTISLDKEREKSTELETRLSFLRGTMAKLEPHVRILGKETFAQVVEKATPEIKV